MLWRAENGFVSLEMVLLLAEGSVKKERMGGQLPFGVRCFGYQTPIGIQS